MTLRWRAGFENKAINNLHAEAFDHRLLADDWWTQVNTHSLGWVCAHDGPLLVGFVNVAWDGGVHAFILDTMVAKTHRGAKLATQMLAVCVREAAVRGCEWLHVDFDEELQGFYFQSAGFRPTPAGLIRLK